MSVCFGRVGVGAVEVKCFSLLLKRIPLSTTSASKLLTPPPLPSSVPTFHLVKSFRKLCELQFSIEKFLFARIHIAVCSLYSCAALGGRYRQWHGTQPHRDWLSHSPVMFGCCWRQEGVALVSQCTLTGVQGVSVVYLCAVDSPSAELVAIFRTRRSELLEVLPG